MWVNDSFLAIAAAAWRVFLSAAIAFVGGLSIVSLYETVTAEHELKQALAEMDRLQPRWRFKDLEADLPKIPDAENAFLVVEKAVGLVPKIWDYPPELDFEWEPPNRLTSPEILKILKKEIADRGPSLEIGRTLDADARGRGPWKFGKDGLPYVDHQASRALANLLTFDVRGHLEAGDMTKAERSLRAMWGVSHSNADRPDMVSQLVRCAIVIENLNALEVCLGHGELPAKSLQDWRKRFDAEIAFPLARTAYRGELAWLEIYTGLLVQGKVANIAMMIRPVDEVETVLMTMFGKSWQMRMTAWQFRQAPTILKTLELAPRERYLALKRLEDAMTKELRQSFRLRHQFNTLSSSFKIFHSEIRLDARLSCAATALAAEEYRLTHKRWPKSMQELLDANLLPAAPIDPYDGRPLRFRRAKDGIVIYSIGPHGKGDGTAFDNPIGNEEAINQRIEFRLWDVDQRRQKALQRPAPPPPLPDAEAA